MIAASFLFLSCVAGWLTLARGLRRTDNARPAGVPEFVLETTDGFRLTREDLRGSRYFLLFLRMGCAHCRRAVIELDRLTRSAPSKDLSGWVISNGSTESVRSFQESLGVRVPFATMSTSWSQFGAGRVPTMILVDRSGRVERVWQGAQLDGRAEEILSAFSASTRSFDEEPLLQRSSPCSACSAP